MVKEASKRVAHDCFGATDSFEAVVQGVWGEKNGLCNRTDLCANPSSTTDLMGDTWQGPSKRQRLHFFRI